MYQHAGKQTQDATVAKQAFHFCLFRPRLSFFCAFLSYFRSFFISFQNNTIITFQMPRHNHGMPPGYFATGPGHEKTCLMPYANNKGADQAAHPRSLSSTFVVRCLDSMIYILAISEVLIV